MNAIYNVLFKLRRVELKPEVRAYKTTMKMYVPSFAVKEDQKLGISFAVHQDWYFKNGTFRKQDVQNMAKVLVDLIAEKMGFEDSQVWRMDLEKVQSTSENYVEVKITKLNGGLPHDQGAGISGREGSK